jgi:N-acetylglucosaminyldiphosphoundecaprenol N-acetyl-beta-D-mannosaminyltransferase
MDKRFNFLDVKISVINFDEAFQCILARNFPTPGYICFPDASVVAKASEDHELALILNRAFLTMPDGKPSQLAAHLQGHKDVTTVSGYHLCSALLTTGLSHYFYGGDEVVIQKIRTKIKSRFPEANVLGFRSPPFVNKEDIPTSMLIQKDIQEINLLSPDLVWIGISSPKQDYLMSHFSPLLNKSLMLGVGGVFLYFADESLISPEWVKKAGLRWMFRLVKEPARLWPKYYGTFRFLLKNFGFFLNAFLHKKSAS